MQTQLRKEMSAIEALLAVRERNRRMALEEYIEKIGLGKKFDKLTRKKNT